jgi:CheY-like chemotaxis protein
MKLETTARLGVTQMRVLRRTRCAPAEEGWQLSAVGVSGGGGTSGQARRVLVVEDEALICIETADTLEHQGFEVHTAFSGEDALRRLGDGLAVDILFTDINLAGAMDGATLALLARDRFPGLLVVYTSGTVERVAQGVAGSIFVPKPYSPERVGRMLSGMHAARA